MKSETSDFFFKSACIHFVSE